MRVPLTRRGGTVVAHAIVDEEQYERLSGMRWHLYRGYAAHTLRNGSKILMHREVVGAKPRDGSEIHHLNGDRLDNRRDNLKITTKAEHQHEHAGRSASGFRGVYWHTNGRWQAQVKCKGIKQTLGYFDDPREASQVVEDWWAAQRREPPYSGSRA